MVYNILLSLGFPSQKLIAALADLGILTLFKKPHLHCLKVLNSYAASLSTGLKFVDNEILKPNGRTVRNLVIIPYISCALT